MTRLLDEVGRDYVVCIIVIAGFVTKYNEADDGRRLTQYTDRVLMDHTVQTFTTNLNTMCQILYHLLAEYRY